MPTIGDLKRLIQAQIAPGDDETFLRLMQECEIRLVEHSRFSWTRAKVTVNPVSGVVTLPTAYASILGATVDGHARDIRAEDFSFAPGGPGEVRVENTADVVLVDQGLDNLGQRTYKVTGNLPDTTSIVCLCHRTPATLYDPDLQDDELPADATDTTTCPSLAAMKNAAMAIIQEEQNEPERSIVYMGIALKILDSAEKAVRGGARQQFNIRPNGSGIRPIRSFR